MSSIHQTSDLPSSRVSSRGEPAWEIAHLFPSQGAWSESDYLSLDTNRMIELSNGCIEVLPMPTIFHQLIVQLLFDALHRFVSSGASGMVLMAPVPVRLWDGKFREPDLVYLRRERVHTIHGQPSGADLVMEVVSAGGENRERDLHVKRSEYAVAGIGEYWIVEPEEQRITVLTLEGQTYREHGIFGAGEWATSVLLPGFTVSVSDVFAAGQADL